MIERDSLPDAAQLLIRTKSFIINDPRFLSLFTSSIIFLLLCILFFTGLTFLLFIVWVRMSNVPAAKFDSAVITSSLLGLLRPWCLQWWCLCFPSSQSLN